MVRLLEAFRAVPCLLFVAAAAALLAGCGNDKVTIARTEHGVAHVRAHDYRGLAYGVGYAHAEDNYCQTLDHLITLRGQRLRFDAGNGAQLGLHDRSNEAIDRFIGYAMDDRALARAAKSMSADARAMVDGYVAGYSKYVDDHYKDLAKICERSSWLTKLTKDELKMQRTDFLRWMEEFATIMSSATLVEEILSVQPPPLPAAKWWQFWKSGCRPSSDAVPFVARPARQARGGEAGSNGWAFGRDVTVASGDKHPGVLVANPHFFWEGPLRFWQLHLTMGDLDVMGAVMGQWPVVQIGFNRDVAWTHTVSTGRRFAIYELAIKDPDDPCTYEIAGPDGRMRTGTIERKRVRIKREQGGDLITEVWHAPGYGPVIVYGSLQWTDQHVYVLRDANHLNLRSIDAWLGIAHAKNVAEVGTAAERLGIQWSNTIAADRNGDVLYADYSAVPKIADTCLLPEVARSRWPVTSLPVVDGKRTRCGWAEDGRIDLIPRKDLPSLQRTDYVLNGNDSYWLTNPKQRLSGFSPLIGRIDVKQSLRTRAGLLAVDEHVDRAGRKIDLDSARRLLLSNRNMAGELVLDDLLQACATHTPNDTDLVQPCAALKNWNRTSRHDDPGAVLFRTFWTDLAKKDVPWAVDFQPVNPITTPRGLEVTDPATAQALMQDLKAATNTLAKDGLKPDATLEQVQRKSFVLKGGKVQPADLIAVDGGDEAEGVLNKLQFVKTENARYEPKLGTSYVQVVTFDKDGPVADALLLYGQSSNTGDNGQLQRFFDDKFVRLPFRRVDVDSRKVSGLSLDSP